MIFNEMKKRVTLLKAIETTDDEANRTKDFHFVADVWANVVYKPKYIAKNNATEQVLVCSLTIRKRELDFDAVKVDGRLLELKIPPYSDRVWTYIHGEVNFHGKI